MLSPAVVHIGFRFGSYVAMESLGQVSVCVVIDVTSEIVLDRPVFVELSTAVNGTANGKYKMTDS